MKTNLSTRGVLAISAILLLGGGVYAARAANSQFLKNADEKKGNFMVERVGNMKHKFKGELSEEKQAQMEARFAAHAAQFEAIKTALDAADYDAWVKAVKAVKGDALILEKINAGNFSRYLEAYKLHNQADAIMNELGIEKPGMGFGLVGLGGMDHMGRGKMLMIDKQ